MADVWLGRFNRWVEKVFNVKGGPTIVDFSPTVQTFLQIPDGVETRALQGWNRFGAVGAAPAVAAQNAAVMLHNPSGSNTIMAIEYISAYQTTAVTRTALNLQIANGLADFGATVTPLRLDFRQKQGATAVVSVGTTGASGNIAALIATGGSVTWISTENQELAIAPGDQYIVVDVTQNEGITVGFIWRERALESSELT